MTAPSSPRAKRSNRRRLWLFFFLTVPLILIAATIIVVRQAGTDRLTNAIAEADRLDPGWRLDDIEASRKPMPPAGKNGMDQVLAIKAALNSSPNPWWSFPAYEKNGAYLRLVRLAMDESLSAQIRMPRILNDEQVRVLVTKCTKEEKAIQMARALVEFSYGRFDLVFAVDWFTTNLAHSHDARASGELLRYDALLRAHKNDMHGALRDFRAILHGGRAVGDEPFAISQLVHMAMAAAAVNSLERSLGLGVASEQDLVVVQRYLTEESSTPYYLNGIRGERAGMDRFLESVQNGTIDFKKFSQLIGNGSSANLLGQLWLLQMYWTIRSQRAEMLEWMNEFVEIGKSPSDKQSTAFAALNKKLKETNKQDLVRLLLPAYDKIAQADIRTKAILRVAVAGVAAERFRMAKGHWPKELAELVPTYLDAVPLDPFDGKPLRLKISDGAFVVYSVGMDGVDNGGQLDDKPFQPGSDIGFRLFDVDKRRQPALPFVFPPEDRATDK